jgi:hypothetical protein
MPLLGSAAMLLSFDVLPEAVAEHDHWHTHEHLPERLAIPGFLRGTRWVALPGQQPRYMVLYEVQDLATLASDAYLARLNQPTPWTTKMMPHYRGMQRGLCAVAASAGLGSGHLALLTRFTPGPSLGAALGHQVLARLAQRPGLGSVHLLQGALVAQMTQEQRIRGADAGVEAALLVTGYEQPALAALAEGALSPAALQAQGAQAVVHTLYRLDYTLMAAELAA